MTVLTRGTSVITCIITLFLASHGSALAAPPHGGGGGGGKVKVEAANPSDAFQGEELDVTVTGSGFDSGSTVDYLVTGTTDASQVEVLSVQYISSTELKTRVRPKENALPIDYDIEVRTSSGRKGKGTTLFRVKVSETTCTGDEPKEPEIVFLSSTHSSSEADTNDLYLSSASGCDVVLLLDDAVRLEKPSNPNDGVGTYTSRAVGPRVDVDNDLGIVAWMERSISPIPVIGWTFGISADGQIIPDPSGPRILYQSSNELNVQSMDVRITDQREIELILDEKLAGGDQPQLSHYNVDTNVHTIVTADPCQALGDSGSCYQQYTGTMFWSESGERVFFEPTLYPSAEGQALAVIERLGDDWQQPQVLMEASHALQLAGISGDDLLAYEYLVVERNKKGKRSDSQWFTAIVDPSNCLSVQCAVTEDLILPIDSNIIVVRGWTRFGSMLYGEVTGGVRYIRELSDPWSGTVGSLKIPNAHPWERDTTF